VRETKRTRRERECGLGFAWQLPESSTWALFCAVAITGALAVALFGGLRVRVVPPPRVIERKAEAVMIPADAEGRNWAILAQEAGPFPTRFEPSSWPAMRALEAGSWPQLASRVERRPKLHEWPAEPTVMTSPAAAKGQRVLPQLQWRQEAPPEAGRGGGWKLDLQRLTVLPAEAWPKALPDFQGEVTPEMAAASWRFLVRVGSGGRVEDCLALNPASPGGAGLESWLRGLRFGRAAAGAGWIGVGVNFNRKP
jgi:hypothetical protein